MLNHRSLDEDQDAQSHGGGHSMRLISGSSTASSASRKQRHGRLSASGRRTWTGKTFFMVALVGLLTSTAFAQFFSVDKEAQEEDAQLGQVVTPARIKDTPEEGEEDNIEKIGELSKDYKPVLPFTEEQERERERLKSMYPADKELNIQIDSLEPNAGPLTGDTRVLVRGGPFEKMDLLYPNPKCKFGTNSKIVSATYVKCSQKPHAMEDIEGKNREKKFWCLQCENSPPSEKAVYVSLMISLKGDFSDTQDSEPFRYYDVPTVTAIEPQYGPKDGGTVVRVWGTNFMNYGQDLRCNFGSKSVIAEYKSPNYLICKAPFSDVTNKPITFSVSMNKQQNTRELLNYWYYAHPHIAKLEPNYGPDQGGNVIDLLGSNLFPFIDEPSIDNSNSTKCIFYDLGDVTMPMKMVSQTRAQCQVPPATGNVTFTDIDITLNNQNYTDDGLRYYYYKPPQIYNIEPREGPTRGGTDVRVFAPNFKKHKHILCHFGDTATRGKHISKTEVQCISPPHQPPEKVPIAVSYEEDGLPSRSNELKYQYYETPEIISISPPCGPTYGRTQITIKGRHFIDLGFGRAFCVFNGTRWMNTTIINEETLLCQSPPLTRFETLLTQQDMVYKVQVTLNAHDLTNTSAIFHYYHEPEIQQVLNSNMGPVSGDTHSILVGRNFNQKNICNMKVRYGALDQSPKKFNDTHIATISPRVNVPGAVALAASGNGQNYGKDWVLHQRDIQNTFTYYQEIFVYDLHPQAGPTTGNTKVDVSGIGFRQFKYENGTIRNDIPIYVKFIDSATLNMIGNVTKIETINNDQFSFHTPPAVDGTKAILQISLNGQNWEAVIPAGKQWSYYYFNAPQVTSISPAFGPVKAPETQKAIITGQNFDCPQGDCSKCIVRFGEGDQQIYVPGKVLSSTQIEVEIPEYPKPDILPVEVSMNGRDFTNNHKTYGYFDAFLLDVQPRLISKKGYATLTYTGFGFVNSDQQDLKAKFLSTKGKDLECDSDKNCITSAQFVDKQTLTASTYPYDSVKESNQTQLTDDEFITEVSVYGNSFTENELKVRYIEDPEYLTINRNSVPKNMVIPLVIETNFHWESNDPDYFVQHANFTCRFKTSDKTFYTQARMESMPLGAGYNEEGTSILPSHLICPSPKVDFVGKTTLDISPNGQEYNSKGFDFEFSEEIDIYRIAPQSGPKSQLTKVKLIGNGFTQKNNTAYAKIGNFQLQPIARDQVLETLWSQENYLGSMLMSKDDLRTFRTLQTKLSAGQSVQTVWSEAPEMPRREKSKTGGPVFITAGQIVELDVFQTAQDQGRLLEAQDSTFLNMNSVELAEVSKNSTLLSSELPNDSFSDHTSQTIVSKPGDRFIFTESPVEFYYYPDPVLKKIYPTSGLTKGGTPLEISGAWFDQKPQYGVIPYCMIGDKIVRAKFISTVRLVCHTPPNDNTQQAMPVKVSLNGLNWVDAGLKYSYFNEPTLYSNEPTYGPMIGGTDIYIYGSQFSNITDAQNIKCKFTLYGSDREARPKYMPLLYVNETYVKCMSPNGFKGGEKVHIQVTYNDQDYTPISDALSFNYFVIFSSFPASGPADDCLDQAITIKGAGLKQSMNIMCQLNGTLSAPLSVSENLIRCQMCSPNKNPQVLGPVKFGLQFMGAYHDFGDFFYYKQITFDEMTPSFGPAVGEGIITMRGLNFRNDFTEVAIGCKVGESIGKGEMLDSETIVCVVQEMKLVDEGQTLPVKLSLNSYSWVGGSQNEFQYLPYGITHISPATGPYDSITEITIEGKGFKFDGFPENDDDKVKCRFGVDKDFAITEGVVQDYTRLTCRSPENFQKPENSDETLSVPIGISFGQDADKPYTLGTWRYRFYTHPEILLAKPDRVKIGRFEEIYLIGDPDTPFLEPLPSGNEGDQTGIVCRFEEFGTSIGIYINSTAILCVSPHIEGHPSDYSEETVQVTVAMNGQDFNVEHSDAYVTFVGTGVEMSALYYLLAAILGALLILALIAFCTGLFTYLRNSTYVEPKQNGPKTIPIRYSGGHGNLYGYEGENYFRASLGASSRAASVRHTAQSGRR